MLNTIDDPKIDWLGKRVFCRLDLNVPLSKAGDIADDTRIRATLETISYLMEKGARLVVASHLGRPKGKFRAELSLEPVALRLQSLLDREVIFAHDCIGDGIKRLLGDLKPGSLLMLENLRFHSGEEKNEEAFAKLLAQNIDVYVNDAFGAAHRAHASVAAISRFIPMRYAGFLIKTELENLSYLKKSPQKPFLAILGGSKAGDKIGAIAHLLPKIDTLIIGGAMAYTFLKAKGIEIGKSLYEPERLNLASTLLQKASSLGVEVILPSDHITAQAQIVKHLGPQDVAIDIGPVTRTACERPIYFAKTVFWNGPVGIFEQETGSAGTLAIIKAIVESKAFSVVGGGDTIAALNKAGLAKSITHVSTGGGASLAFLQGAELPGLAALA